MSVANMRFNIGSLLVQNRMSPEFGNEHFDM